MKRKITIEEFDIQSDSRSYWNRIVDFFFNLAYTEDHIGCTEEVKRLRSDVDSMKLDIERMKKCRRLSSKQTDLDLPKESPNVWVGSCGTDETSDERPGTDTGLLVGVAQGVVSSMVPDRSA